MQPSHLIVVRLEVYCKVQRYNNGRNIHITALLFKQTASSLDEMVYEDHHVSELTSPPGTHLLHISKPA